MTRQVRPRLIVFDLDGTLIDSIGDIAASANQTLVEFFGAEASLPVSHVREFIGGGARQLIERCLSGIGRPGQQTSEVFDRFLAVYRSRLTETTALYEGVADVLDALAPRASLAILTNKPGDMSRGIVHALGLEARFMANIGGGDLATKKPDPEGLAAIMKAACVRPEDTAMVGDSAIDVETARNAGAVSVGVTWGYDRDGMERARPDHVVTAPRGLRQVLIDAS